MNPEKIAFEHCDLEEVFSAVHKATQCDDLPEKSSNYSNDSKGKSNCDVGPEDKGSVTVLEFTQILQNSDNPTSITVVRESLSEDIRHHPDNIVTGDGTSNRYRYSKEIIKPYIKLESEKCLSQEKLVSIALDSANKEYPQCQPCEDTNPNTDSKANKEGNSPPRPVSKDIKGNECCYPPKSASKDNIDRSVANTNKELEVDKSDCLCNSDTQVIKNFCQLYDECENLEDKKSDCSIESDTKDSSDKKNICQLMTESKTAGTIKTICQLIPSNVGIEVKKPCADKNFDKISTSTSFTSKENLNMEKKPEGPCPKAKTDQPCDNSKKRCPPTINPCTLVAKQPGRDHGCQEKKPEKKIEKEDPCKIMAASGENTFDDCKMKPTIGFRASRTPGEKPHYFLTETKVCEEVIEPSSISQIQKAMLNAHCETMNTIQLAMEDFFCNIYKSTQDTVTRITDESTKHLEKLKHHICDPDTKPKKVSENRSAETVTSFNLFTMIGQQNVDCQGSSKYFNPTDMLVKIADKVDSAISMVGEKINQTLPALKRTLDNTSSCKSATPSDDVPQVHLLGALPVPSPTNVFTAIKSRIFSMFSDRDLNTKNSISSKSSTSSSSSSSLQHVRNDSD